jgi:hypothetical protein
MAHNTGHTGSAAEHIVEWLDSRLLPILGPPPIGPFDEADAPTPAIAVCPLCGIRMSLHRVEREGAHAYLHCPDPAVTVVAESGRAA